MILQCCSTAEQHRLSRRVAAAFCRTRCAACLSSPAQGSGFQPCLLPSPFPALSSNDLVDVLTLWCERLAHHSPARRSAASGLTRPALKPCQPHTVKVTPLHILPAPGRRAYHPGPSRWAYHQLELKIAEQAGSRRAVVRQAAHAADAPFPEPAQVRKGVPACLPVRGRLALCLPMIHYPQSMQWRQGLPPHAHQWQPAIRGSASTIPLPCTGRCSGY